MAGTESDDFFSLDELMDYAKPQISDLDRLGLGGLPEVIEAYKLDQPHTRELISKLANTAFKQFAFALHSDYQQEHAAVGPSDFQAVTEAVKAINDNPIAAVEQHRLQNTQVGDARRADRHKINVVYEMQERIKDNRERTAEMLYNTPYANLVPNGVDAERLTLRVMPQELLNTLPGDSVNLPLSNGELASFAYEVRLGLAGNALTMKNATVEVMEYSSDNEEDAASPNAAIVTAHLAKYAKDYKKLDQRVRTALKQLRIIGGVQVETGKYLGPTADDLDFALELDAGMPAFDAASLIDAEPRNFAAIDRQSLRLQMPSSFNDRYDLIMARRMPNGKLLVGSLGGYVVSQQD